MKSVNFFLKKKFFFFVFDGAIQTLLCGQVESRNGQIKHNDTAVVGSVKLKCLEFTSPDGHS